jgi:uncharacterized protein
MTPLARLVDRFEDATVRDLAWLLCAPGLLRADHAGVPLAEPFDTESERDAVLDWLAALDAAPDAFHVQARNPKLTRLGIYAESLLEYFLAHGPAARLIAANVSLRRHRLTIGELDFLLENAAGARLHWELAVKFYLHIGNGAHDASDARLPDYVGPNLQDRFDLKHARLVEHQLTLTSSAEFAALGLHGPWQPQLFIKGRLFYHRGESVAPAPEIAAGHLRGWWMTRAEWRAAHGTEDARRDGRVWVVQPRMAWLASRRLNGTEATDARAQLQAIVTPTLVAVHARDAAGAWFEESRGFIVPDDWPERARAFAAATL